MNHARHISYLVGRQKRIVVIRNNEEVCGYANTRIYPLDCMKKKRQRAVSSGYEGLNYAKPPMPLTVVYEDNHMAVGEMTRKVSIYTIKLHPLSSFLVNKPSGMICHSLAKGGFHTNSVLR